MPAQLSILLCFVGVAILFYLDRNSSIRTSGALWLPILWIGIGGSRGVSGWLGGGPPLTPEGSLQGNPLDATIYGALLVIGLLVLLARRRNVRAYLTLLAPLIAYSAYCLISVTWSPIPGPALKRWTKDVGDIVMVLIVATETNPVDALRRLFSRIGFFLLPLSVVLIRYTTIGRAWNNDGKLENIGVTTNKNMLGLIVFLISLGALWNVRWLFTNKDEPNRRRRLLAEGILLVCGLALLSMAQSSTSIGCFLLGGTLILVTHLRAISRRPSRAHWLCLAILLAAGLTLFFGGEGNVAGVMGRQSSLSGRTDIWAALLPTVSNPIIGTGFDSYWNSPNVLLFQRTLLSEHWYPLIAESLNEAHNGYLEVYLNLGYIGVVLLALILTTGYWSAYKTYRRDPELGSLLLALILTGVFYGITEAGFRTLSPMWIFLLLAVVCARGAEACPFFPLGASTKDRGAAVSWTANNPRPAQEPDGSYAGEPAWSARGAISQERFRATRTKGFIGDRHTTVL